MSRRSASQVRVSKRVERGVREVRAAVLEIRSRSSEAAGVEAKRVHQDAPAPASSPASPRARSAAVTASRDAGAAVSPSPGTRQRDPRLGRFANVGAFLMACDRQLGIARPGVMQIAELLRRDDPLLLADYPGGLNALYAACESRVKGAPA